MNAPREVSDAVRRVQTEAADPGQSVFVSANAGSGKTHVLVQRVVNLLLRGSDPAKILCITFTKAAAANMATRVFKTLAHWTTLDDAALDARIAESTGKPADATLRARARRLFADALETPGGLKVQTIHAFCTRLLHQFPFEADVAARFTVLDDASTAQLLEQITLQVLLDASAAPESTLGRALSDAIVAAADSTFKEMIGEAIQKRDALQAWVARTGGVPQAIRELAQILNVSPDDTQEAVEHAVIEEAVFLESEWPDLIGLLATGSTSDRKHIEALNAAQSAQGRERVDAYLRVFCKADLAPRDRILTKRLAEAHPDWHDRLLREQARVCALLERRRAVEARDRSAALLTIASEVIARYRAEKDRRALLDYDDLIDKTLALFAKTSAAWVLYKLDLGIDHVLVDEAQDTSPKQWDIIKTIVAEFVPGGAGTRTNRTVFAVGDEKQSIFSFQGAAPHSFADMRKHFAGLWRDSGATFSETKFNVSFRSGSNVLAAVDEVFRHERAYRGLSVVPAPTVHESVRDEAPGLVELWGLVGPDEKREIEGWDAPFDTVSEQSPPAVLARRIAKTLKIWIDRGERAGDMLVLVRQRGPLFGAIIRALKNEGVPVAGADRLKLIEHIAVMDLTVLADALLLPDDDLALATALRSPLFAFDDDQLFALAWNRKAPLRTMLRQKASDDPMFAAAARALDELSELARRLTPFAFFAHVLGARKGRARFFARLGYEAGDALDEFLNLALDYERRETPSLHGLLDWLRSANAEVKRDMEMNRDEVRVMTVHGAKGLEARTVILADTTGKPGGPRDPRLLHLLGTGTGGDNRAIVWATRRDNDVGPMAQTREAAQGEAIKEYARLLYVALTRAAERLVVCGYKGPNKIPDGCWYQLVEDALSPLMVAEPADDDGGEVRRFYKTERPEIAPHAAAEPPAADIALPGWLRQTAAPSTPAIRVVAPSDTGDDETHRFAEAGDRDLALRRGTLVHRLMQSLPDIPPPRRADAARRYLGRTGQEFTETERAAMAAQVLALLDDPRFAPLFAPGSRAEVSIAGRLTIGAERVLVAGQVDRLVVTADQVLIADYKTNRPAPQVLADVPPRYIRQLALYRAVLQTLYPDKTVRAALVWTERPESMELPAMALDDALGSL